MTKKNNQKLGFSLIELSIVILIIGILVAGVTQGSRLVAKSKTSAGKALTQSSPVTSINGLSLWLETTLDRSFKPTEAVSGTHLSGWYDIQDVANKNSITQGTSANQPTYQENVINGLPVVRFDGTNDYFSIAGGGAFMTGNAYSAFYVVRVTATPATTSNFFPLLASSGTAIAASGTTYTMSFIGKVGTGTINVCDYWNTANDCSGTLSLGAAWIKIISVANETDTTITPSTRRIFINGLASTAGTPATGTSISPTDLVLGKNGTDYFTGDIGEVIVFTRALPDAERNVVECYLSKKWGIGLDPNASISCNN